MSASILVAYATRYGSTQQVAEAIAATLRECGLEVDLQPMRKVRILEGYRAVVLGAPVYIGSWHKDAQRFLSQHRQALTERPVAIFALGPTHTDEKERQGSRAQLDKELAKLRFPDNLIARLPASPLYNAPASDLRDWTAIRAWASNLVAKLQPALPK